MAPKSKQPNTALAAAMAEARFSNTGLADRVVRLGSQRGAPDLHYNHSSVARWLRGARPRHPVPELLAEVFTVALGRPVTPGDIGMDTADVPSHLGLELPVTQAAGVHTATLLWQADIDQQRAVVASDVDPAASDRAALRWVVGPWDPTPVAGHRRIGVADVEEVRKVTSTLRVLDNRVGGGHVRGTVVGYLHSHVGPLLRDGRGTEETRRALFSAAADLTKLAAWLYHDMDRQGLAQRYLIQALAMARHAGDHGLGGEILAAMSQQAHYIAQPTRAVDLARAAQLAAQRAAMPVLMAECQVMEAQAYAAQQEARACAMAITRAEASYDRAPDEQLPPWLDYFDDAYFSARMAHCFRDLNHPDQAERYALQSLDMDLSYRRGRAFNLALLATALGRQGKVDEACDRARTAMDIAAGLTSARVYRYLRDVISALAPYADEPPVRDLMDYAEVTVPALRQRAEPPSP